VHGFNEFFGYLYHLDAMSDPYWHSFANDPASRNKMGPRDLVHNCGNSIQMISDLAQVRKAAAEITKSVAGLGELISKLDKEVAERTGLGSYERR
jgi:hypothetical protein